ncbi:PP2C family protein-serine/threonine phosphatase [Nonomuraea thailandensis]
MVGRDPSLKGMGTTLTAMLWNGTQVALVHVGDSRAYLLRRGELYQITHDHTLVQQLVDDGRITPEEAATHPQRSILLRALDGSGEVDPDLTLREAQVGDRYLLCSDGLSGVVSAETLHATLTNIDDPEEVVRQLIDLANRGGGPDNITCVLADVLEITDGQQVPAEAAVVGAAGMTRLHGSPQDTSPGRANAVTAPQPVITDDEFEVPDALRRPGGPAGVVACGPCWSPCWALASSPSASAVTLDISGLRTSSSSERGATRWSCSKGSRGSWGLFRSSTSRSPRASSSPSCPRPTRR